MKPDLIPEDRLCLLLARGCLSAPLRDEALTLLGEPLRWDLVLQQAKEHEVYPLLYRNLKDLGFPGTPSAVRAELGVLFRTNALRNSLLANELAQLLGALNNARIPAIPLKGLFLAQSLYGDMSLRVCADLDILIPPRHVARAAELLAGTGYQAKFPSWFLEDSRLGNNVECAFFKADRSVEYLVELHWALLIGGTTNHRNMKALWDSALRGEFLGVPIHHLGQEMQMLVLVSHAARHNWQGLKWLVDIHDLCARPDLSWDKVLALAKQFGWEQLLRWTLGACRMLLDTPLPIELSRESPPPQGRLFPARADLPPQWRVTLLYLRLAAGPSEKLFLLLRRFFVPTPEDYEFIPFPSSLLFLYYLVRPFRLAWMFVGSLRTFGLQGRSRRADSFS